MSTLHIFKESLILTIHTCRDIRDGFSVEKPTLGGTTETPCKKEERMREKKRKEGIEEEDRQTA